MCGSIYGPSSWGWAHFGRKTWMTRTRHLTGTTFTGRFGRSAVVRHAIYLQTDKTRQISHTFLLNMPTYKALADALAQEYFDLKNTVRNLDIEQNKNATLLLKVWKLEQKAPSCTLISASWLLLVASVRSDTTPRASRCGGQDASLDIAGRQSCLAPALSFSLSAASSSVPFTCTST